MNRFTFMYTEQIRPGPRQRARIDAMTYCRAPADVVRGVEQVPVADVDVQALQLRHVHQQPQLLIPHRVARAVLDLRRRISTSGSGGTEFLGK